MGFKTIDDLINTTQKYKDKLLSFSEEWKQIKAYDILPIYKVSNHGNIKESNGKKIYPYINSKGYAAINLKTSAGIRKNFLMHRIIALTFIEVPSEYIEAGYVSETLTVNHINGIKYHNATFNLEWCTHKENVNHAHKSGLAWRLHGEHHANSKFPIINIHQACEYLTNGESNKYIKEKTGVTDGTIYSLARGDTHKDISSQYKIKKRTKSLPTNIIDDICKDIAAGKIGAYSIAKKYNVSPDYVYSLRNHEYRSDITHLHDFSKSLIKDRLSSDTMNKIKKDIKSAELSPDIAAKYGISLSYVKTIKYRKMKKDAS